MRILYFHQHFSTRDGATGTRSYEMARSLIKKGHSVTMVCGSFGAGKTGLVSSFKNSKRQGIVDKINVIEFNIKYSNNDGVIKRCLAFFKFSIGSIWIALLEDYDILFATSTPLTAGIPGLFGRWLRKKEFVFEVRDLWPELPKEMGIIKNPIFLSVLKFLEWSICNSAHRCVALSPGILEGITKCGVAKNKISMIPNGCDMNLFKKENNSPWLPEGITSQDFVAVFCGTHGQANGLSSVLDAATVLRDREKNDIKFVLIGEGGGKKELQKRAIDEKLDNVIFHPPVSKTHLAGLLTASDIGIQCLKNIPAFYYGTSPNKFFDYISAGLPVLVNYPGWVSDIVKENSCGYISSPDNPKEFADLLESAHANKAILKQKGVNALKVAKNNFDRVDLSEKWIDWVLKG